MFFTDYNLWGFMVFNCKTFIRIVLFIDEIKWKWNESLLFVTNGEVRTCESSFTPKQTKMFGPRGFNLSVNRPKQFWHLSSVYYYFF